MAPWVDGTFKQIGSSFIALNSSAKVNLTKLIAVGKAGSHVWKTSRQIK